MLLREECLVGLVAELAVQPLRRGQPRDLGIDQSLRQGKAIFVGEGHQRALIDQVIDDGVEIAHDRRIAGVRLLLPHLLQPALEQVGEVGLLHLLIADLGQRAAAHDEARRAGAEVRQIGKCEAAEDRHANAGDDPRPDFRFCNAAEKGEHRVPGANGRCGVL